MDQTTIQTLLELNQSFYQQVAPDFDQSRQYFWAGWQPLVQPLATLAQNSEQLTVADLGCGNARFATFLATQSQTWPQLPLIKYFGTDNSPALLERAQTQIATQLLKNLDLKLHSDSSFCLDQLELTDLSAVNSYLAQGPQVSAGCLFGVLHHLPSAKFRLQLLQTISHHLAPGGLLIFSLWEFMKDPRLAKKVMTPEQITTRLGLDPADLESGDQILDWQRGQTAWRYCHHFAADQIDQLSHDLATATNLQLIDRYQADGPDHDLNTYLVWQKPTDHHILDRDSEID